MGCTPRLALEGRTVPGVYLCMAPAGFELPALRTWLWELGIQCSVFYGEQAFFVPVHQGLEREDLDYIARAITEFFSNAA